MLFSSFAFIFAFLPFVWVVFHALKSAKFATFCTEFSVKINSYTIAKIFLIISSLFFYAFWKVAYLPIMLGSIIVNYTLAKAILNANKGGGQCIDSKFTSKSYLAPKFYFILGIIFNLSLLCFFKYTDFLLENFNLFSQIAHLDFEIPLPHILLPLALSFVTFQQIAFLFDCYKHAKGQSNENLNSKNIDFIDYALFISFFPQLIAGPIVHHREMMPQFAKMSANSSDSNISSLRDSANRTKNTESATLCHTDPERSEGEVSQRDSSVASLPQNDKSTINYEFLAKGIFIFSIGLFKKVFIADSFAKWANAGFGIVENGGVLNIAESWATSLSYTFQLYFDFSGYCDMAMGLALMFGIVLPLNFNSPYKSLNIAEFWRRWHITLGRFLKECLYIPLGGNRGNGNSSLTRPSRELEKISFDRQQVLSHSNFSAQPTNLTQDTRTANVLKNKIATKILTLRNLFIVAFLSGIWHGAGWGFVIWGVLHGVAMVIHRVYAWFMDSLQNKTCHTERSEVSKPHESNQNNESMIDKRINELDSPLQHCDSSHSMSSDLVSSVASLPQNDKIATHFTQSKIYKILAWFITFNFVNIAWVFFRAENVSGAVNLLKGMFGIVWVDLPQQAYKANQLLKSIDGTDRTFAYIIIAIIVCLACKNSFEMLKNFDTKIFGFKLALRFYSKKIWLKGGAVFTRFALTLALFYISIWILLKNVLDSNAYTPFLYFNF